MNDTPTFEDFKVGQTIPAVVLNLTLHRLVLHAGGNRDLTSLHYDDDAGAAAGARGAFINNVFAMGMWERAVREFAGPSAIIHSISGLKMSSFNCVGDVLSTRGEVARTWSEDGVGFVELSIETHNQTTARTTVGPGTVLISVRCEDQVVDSVRVSERYRIATKQRRAALAFAATPPNVTPTGDLVWDPALEFVGTNILKVPSLDGADRVEPSVIRRLCEPLELASELHYDTEYARGWGYDGVVGPVCGLGTVYPDPGAWHPGEPTNYPHADRDAPPQRPGGIESGNQCARLPFPDGSISILTSAGFDLDGPIHVGDLLSVRSIRLVKVVPKRTSVGDGAFLTFVNEVWNETSKVGEVTKVQFQYLPTATSPPANHPESRTGQTPHNN